MFASFVCDRCIVLAQKNNAKKVWRTSDRLLSDIKMMIKLSILIKLNPVEAETTKSNESDNFLPVAREADLSTGPT